MTLSDSKWLPEFSKIHMLENNKTSLSVYGPCPRQIMLSQTTLTTLFDLHSLKDGKGLADYS